MKPRLPMLVTALALVGLLTACQQPESPILNEEATPMDLAALPTLRQTQQQMLGLIDDVRQRISEQVPAAAAWHWNREWATSGCPGEVDEGLMLYFPNLVTTHNLSTAEWDRVFPLVERLSAAAGLTEVSLPGNAENNHDARFSSADGRQLLLGAAGATVISARISCREIRDEPIRVDGEIPMPPDPPPR